MRGGIKIIKTFPECLSCFIDDITGALFTLTDENEKREEFLKLAIKKLSKDFNFNKIPSVYITKLHRLLKSYLKEPYPFKALRQRCNRVGVEIRVRVRENFKNLSDYEAFKMAVMWSIAGNHLDMRTVGVGYEKDVDQLKKELEEVLMEGLYVDDREKLFNSINGKNILFVHDNVGEVALDCLLIEALKKRGAKRVTSALRTLPMTSDATIEDGEFVKIQEYADEIIPAAPDTLGLIFEEMTEEMKLALEQNNLIITKGQANFYSFYGKAKILKKPVCFILRTKCLPISTIFGATKPDINVCYFEEG